jgi:hypothetical protein
VFPDEGLPTELTGASGVSLPAGVPVDVDVGSAAFPEVPEGDGVGEVAVAGVVEELLAAEELAL